MNQTNRLTSELSWIASVRRLISFTVRRSVEMELGSVSSTMALATILGIVPVLALSVAIFAAFPGFSDMRHGLEDMILGSFLPEQYSGQIIGYIKAFSQHAAGLTAFGLLGLSFTVFALIDKLFRTVNKIFKSPSRRSLMQRVLIYWALLTLGPLTFVLSLTMSGKALQLAVSSADMVGADVAGWIEAGGQILLQSIGFAVIYKFIPNVTVRWRHALIGGFVVVVAGQALKLWFAHYVASGTLGNIYGAFVALPVLIMWVHFSWMLFFVGAAVTATLPMLSGSRKYDELETGNRFLTGVLILKRFMKEYEDQGSTVVSLQKLATDTVTSRETTLAILMQLQKAGYVEPLISKERFGNWTLIADPSRKTLTDAFEMLAVSGNISLVNRVTGKSAVAGSLEPWYDRLTEARALSLPLNTVFRDDAS